MFVDASAIVAIITREPEADVLADALDAGTSPITSPIAIYEAALAIHRKRQGGVDAAQADVDRFLQLTGTRVVPVSLEQARGALQAFALFGRGNGHPARLNMGDCFAYAAARVAGCSLLFKGRDFIHTDITSALNQA